MAGTPSSTVTQFCLLIAAVSLSRLSVGQIPTGSGSSWAQSKAAASSRAPCAKTGALEDWEFP